MRSSRIGFAFLSFLDSAWKRQVSIVIEDRGLTPILPYHDRRDNAGGSYGCGIDIAVVEMRFCVGD